MKRLTKILLALLLLTVAQQAGAANTSRPLTQVKDAKEIKGKYDWVIKDDVPIVDGGTVNFVETEVTTLIIEKVKPSVFIQKYLSKVLINGEQAKDRVNCQVKMYNKGTIILPYGSNFKPLTVYSEQNFGGTAVDNFGLEDSGGFMNTLTETKLNNQIRSFKLKRGHMVTFSTLPGGRGYSRCFIAADADLEVKTLPAVLDQKISSYRVFRWYDVSKVGLADASGNTTLSSLLNFESTYTWGVGTNMLPDAESVTHHIKEHWPSGAELGKANWTAHIKTNNEPRNQTDPDPSDLATILSNWEELMATGMRLCSPSSWDGSDYWNGTGFLKQFFDSIDARGWRCDIIDLHGYWQEGSFTTNVNNWWSAVKRPIWISEWIWGSSWNNDGIFNVAKSDGDRDNPSQSILSQNSNVVTKIVETLNKNAVVERYFYWNGERNCSKLVINGKLTPTGEMYAKINSGLAYDGKHDYIPVAPKQKAPVKMEVSYDKKERKATMTWYDQNGEYNQSMAIERTDDGGKTWTEVGKVAQKEKPSDYSFSDADGVRDGVGYRVHIVNLNGGHLYSAVVYTKIENIEAGDALTVGDTQMYAGGNILTNGTFDMGVSGWMSGTGETIGQPWFQVVPSGGLDGSAYLQAYGNKDANDASALKTYVMVNPNSYYYLQCDSRNGGSNVAVNVSPDVNSSGTEVAKIPNTAEWAKQFVTFATGDNNYVVFSFSKLGAKAQFDNIELRELFATEEAALADGKACQEAYDGMMEEVNRQKRHDYLYNQIDSLSKVSNGLSGIAAGYSEQLEPLVEAAREATTIETMEEACEALRTVVNELSPTVAAATQPQSPAFATALGWTTKAGTFTGGDQRTGSAGGKTCWNAWWGGVAAAEGEAQTLEVKQELTGLEEGVYALECKATTEHFCLSDQHGYITSASETGESPVLTYDYFDLPVTGSIWQTLTTTAVYVAANGTATIGFKSSKKDAVDNAWRQFGNVNSTGDKREGWWCATDFRLLYHPLTKLTVTPGEWGTICLPYAAPLPKGARFYTIAGITTDGTKICLEPIETLAAGQPAIYVSDEEELVFVEYGDKAESAYSTSQTNNLLGHFASRRATKGSFLLKGGIWVPLIDKGEVTPAQTAYITTLNGMTRLDSWAGATLPIDAAAAGIGSVTVDGTATTATYTIGGRRAANARGLVIETNGKTAKKRIR